MKSDDCEFFTIELDLETIGLLALEAHKKDMKLNDLIVETILKINNCNLGESNDNQDNKQQ